MNIRKPNKHQIVNSNIGKIILNTGEEISVDTEDLNKVKHYTVYLDHGVPTIDIQSNSKKRKIRLIRFLYNLLNDGRRLNVVNGNALDCRKNNYSFSQNRFTHDNDKTIIALSCGEEVTIDREDFQLVKDYTWGLSKTGYVYTKNPNSIYIHRIIMKCPKDKTVDHIDLNKLNNRKENLRICEHMQNTWNRKKYSGSRFGGCTSKYKGVRSRNTNEAWEARIKVNKTQLTIGIFSSELAAANAYNYFAKIYHGEFARLNDCMILDNWFDYLIKRGKTSKFRGVTWSKKHKSWRAAIYLEGKKNNIGLFDTELDAAVAYNQKIKELSFPMTKLNVLVASSTYREYKAKIELEGGI